MIVCQHENEPYQFTVILEDEEDSQLSVDERYELENVDVEDGIEASIEGKLTAVIYRGMGVL
jgi:hypothetical protein